MFSRFACTLLLAAALAAASPLLHYPLERDETPVANLGTASATGRPYLIQPSHYTPAVVGNGLRIYGMADGIVVDDPAKSFQGPCTVSLYFRPEHLVERMTLCSFYVADECLLALKIVDRQLKMLDWSNPKARQTYSCGPLLDLDSWHHVAWSMDGQRWRCWLDGKLVQEAASSALPSRPRSRAFHIGNDWHRAVAQRDRFVGTLDEVQVWDGTLPDAEIQAQAARLAQAAPMARPVRMVATQRPVKASVDSATQSFVFDGRREPMTIYAGGGFLPLAGYCFDTILEMAGQGITVFRSGVCGGRDFCGGNWWQGMGKYDFSIVDRNIEFVFERNPDARLMISLAASPPAWWGRQFPQECTQDANGNVRQDYFASHSFSSDQWIADLEEAWGALFAHMRRQPYYSRVIGFHVVSGRYGECIRNGYNSQLYGKELTDYSPAELAAWRRWLRRRYGSIDRMRRAYPDGRVPTSFEEARLPTPAERLRADSSYFSNPVVDRGNIDYNQFVNDQQAEVVCRYTSLLRRLVGKDKVIGVYYGYVFEDAFGHGRCFASESGHFGIGRVLREAPIDFLVGPVGYAQRTLGSVGPCMGAPATVALHRKLWLDEADIRTSLNGGRAEYSGAADLEESKAVLWRTFGNALVNRAALWWMPISGIRSFSHPDIWRDFGIMYREMARTAAARPALDRSRAIAIIMDTDSIHFRRYSLRDQVAGNLLTLSRDVFAKSGVHIDAYISDDLELIPDDYPVYIFLNTWYADDTKREIIRRRFKQGGKLLVWTYGAGLFRNAQPSARLRMGPQNATELTGMEMEWIVKSAEMDCAPVDGASIPMPGLRIDGKFQPVLAVTDSQAQPLAAFQRSPLLDGKTAVALKRMPGWNSLYIGVPQFTPELVRAIARFGGAHVWSEAGDVVVRPGNGHLLIHSGHEAVVKITLPAPATQVVDVATGEVLGRQCSTLELPIGKNRTRLLRLF